MASFEDQIVQYRRRSLLFVTLIVLVFMVFWWAVLGTYGVLVAAGAALASYAYCMHSLIRVSGARRPDMARRDEANLVNRVDEIAIAAGIPPPTVYVLDSSHLNAFAASRSPRQSIICVTTGGLAGWNQEELQGVVAHELSHIVNGDSRLSSFAGSFLAVISAANAILIAAVIAAITLPPVAQTDRGTRGEISVRICVIVFGMFAVLVIWITLLIAKVNFFAFSRKREYLADSTAVKLTRNPSGLASALQKIAEGPTLDNRYKGMKAFFTANPFGGTRSFQRVFDTHPPLQERIRRLEEMGARPPMNPDYLIK